MTPFGENLRKIRIERGMSQEEFAELLGTSKQVISRYETAQRSPKVSTVSEYSEKLGVSIATLTGDVMAPIRDALGSDSPAAKKLRAIGEQLAPHTTTDTTRIELMELYERLNSNGREALLKYARFLNTDPDMKKAGASSDATA